MRVTYLGPLIAGLQHSVLQGYDLSQFSPSCFLVEIKEGAGLDGPLIEGDMLLVDEGRTPQHNDLVIALWRKSNTCPMSSGSVARCC